jgi:serine/threonine-protein kinase RsbW
LTRAQPACYTLELPVSLNLSDAASLDRRLFERPLDFTVTVETTELTLPSRIDAVNEAAVSIAGILSRSGVAEEVAFGVDMAVREAVTNAVMHGNRQDEAKVVRVTAKNSPEWLEISVDDEGAGFNPAKVPDPTTEENILKSSGRGIFFMRNFMDVVEWIIRPEGGTTVRMTKRF